MSFWKSACYWIAIGLWAVAGLLYGTEQWTGLAREVLASDSSVLRENILSVAVSIPPRQKTPRQTVKGLYLTAVSANDSGKLDEIIKLIDATELNAVVIDIKDYTGYALYDSHLPLVNKLHTKKIILKDLSAIIKKLHQHQIYSIARQTVFQDPALAERKPEWAIKNNSGGVWRDNKGLAWVDATRPEVWRYNIAIAREAAAFGFDEINFDYVRFPSDGNMSLVKYSEIGNKKYQVMEKFYADLSEQLKDEPVWISLDMFGLVMEARGEFDLGIGQRLADAVGKADYICPMMYPSHYPPGHLGFANPAEHPGAVLEHGLKLGLPHFASSTTELRPWIQAFDIGAVYSDGAKIREQIDAVEKYTGSGWLMWNARNRYTSAGLNAE